MIKNRKGINTIQQTLFIYLAVICTRATANLIRLHIAKIKITHIIDKTRKTQNKALYVLKYILSSCSSWSLDVILKYAANIKRPANIIMMTKNTKNPAHNLRITKYNIAITKLHASEPAMAHLVTYKSDIHVESRSTLKNDQLISLAEES